jgi:acyl-CoA synthetase (AMP-forming)/AMP-acid ligase II
MGAVEGCERSLMPGLAVGDWVTAHARYQPGADCIVRADGSRLTYGEVDSLVTRLARALATRGLRPGDRIGILATDSAEYLVLLLASMKLGTTFVALNFRLSPTELSGLLRLAKVTALFLGGRYREVADEVGESLTDGPQLVAWLDGARQGEISCADLIASVSDSSELRSPATDDDILSLALTSGTPARRKACCSHSA